MQAYAHAHAYAYDGNGNRTSSAIDKAKKTYTYNAAGQLTKVGSSVFSYDENGNQLTGGGLTAAYNGRDQATTINGKAVTYEDKDQAQRATYGDRSFLNTPLGVSSYTDPGAKTTTVTREATGQLTALRQPTGATSYPITDALGSVVALTDATGKRTDTFAYDPYGQNADRTGTTVNPFQFTGEYRDPNGLDKIGMRYYQSGTGRWTQIDPLRRATNPTNPPEASPYAYVGNNPTNYTDPTGLSYDDVAKNLVSGFAGVAAGVLVFGFTGNPILAGAAGGCVAGAANEAMSGSASVGSVALGCASGSHDLRAGRGGHCLLTGHRASPLAVALGSSGLVLLVYGFLSASFALLASLLVAVVAGASLALASRVRGAVLPANAARRIFASGGLAVIGAAITPIVVLVFGDNGGQVARTVPYLAAAGLLFMAAGSVQKRSEHAG